MTNEWNQNQARQFRSRYLLPGSPSSTSVRMEGLVLQDGTPLVGFFGSHQAPGSSWTQCHVVQSLFHYRNVLDVTMSVSGLKK